MQGTEREHDREHDHERVDPVHVEVRDWQFCHEKLPSSFVTGNCLSFPKVPAVLVTVCVSHPTVCDGTVGSSPHTVRATVDNASLAGTHETPEPVPSGSGVSCVQRNYLRTFTIRAGASPCGFM